jgi:hypothetical protein
MSDKVIVTMEMVEPKIEDLARHVYDQLIDELIGAVGNAIIHEFVKDEYGTYDYADEVWDYVYDQITTRVLVSYESIGEESS